MSPQSHPEPDALLAYQRDPSRDQYAEIALHLAQCPACREQLQTAAWLQSGFRHIEATTIDARQQEIVEDFVHGQHPPAAREQYRQSIRADSNMLKSALHSLAADAEARDHGPAPSLGNTSTDHVMQRTRLFAWLGTLRDWLDFRSPTWITASLSAALTLGVVLVVLQLQVPGGSSGQRLSIASYQDDAAVYFDAGQAIPGIGFFNTAAVERQPFAPAEVSLDDDNLLQLRWQPVQRAQHYRLQVYRFHQGERQLLHEVQTEANSASIKLVEPPVSARYEWVLSGPTVDDQSFSTRGGFVINGRQSE